MTFGWPTFAGSGSKTPPPGGSGLTAPPGGGSMPPGGLSAIAFWVLMHSSSSLIRSSISLRRSGSSGFLVSLSLSDRYCLYENWAFLQLLSALGQLALFTLSVVLAELV